MRVSGKVGYMCMVSPYVTAGIFKTPSFYDVNCTGYYID